MKKVKIGLVNMPWADPGRPPIQLATLKSFVKKRLPEAEIEILNLSLKFLNYINLDFYRKISRQNVFLVESFYGKLIYPKIGLFKDYPRITKLFDSEKQMELFLSYLKECQEKIFREIEWSKYDIIGFTMSLHQLTSSLYMIKKIKNIFPGIKIIVGGPNLTGEKGVSLLKCFSEIDIAVSGEGELNFLGVVKSCLEKSEDYKKLPGIIYRENDKVFFNPGFNQIDNLSDLEIPDYSDYFCDLKTYEKKIGSNFYVEIPIEFSRGCFHDKCAFCSLNKCWKRYRIKKVSSVLEEIKHFYNKYGRKNFIFCDNILPEKKIRELFTEIKKLNFDVKITSFNISSKIEPSTFKILSEGGLDAINLGIECLNDSILKKMNKPSNLIYNIQSMKMCELYDIINVYGIIKNYPNVTEYEMRDFLKNIELVECYHPPVINRLMVQIYSYIYENPGKNNIKITGNESSYKYCFPSYLLERLNLDYKQYHIDEKTEKLWSELVDKTEKWVDEYKSLKRTSHLPLLYYLRKDKKIIVVRRTLKGDEISELGRIESEICEYCDISKTQEEIEKRFNLSTENLREIIEKLKKEKLIFESNEKFLFLPLNLKVYMENKKPLHKYYYGVQYPYKDVVKLQLG